ncbi:hippurate hydrolase [Moraxella cuniculi DSM 21768]|uniref:Hippurate hydrolase n=1 Tax=Moraxella cuniculi DSM 21768 TaxID=1122245 RepID=A0A1N7FHP0_9GAMM|nr:M20 aminoacylase family protein [Moraxella cuniculi]OOS02273.1 peptidase M20 [Moraxella cuniculi]SIR99755.1 hippurate hydrolase [Moraxella cuniculi DSM 21768]
MKTYEMMSEDFLRQVREWRQHLHANPELGFEEFNTAKMVADILRSLNIEVHENIAGTGVVGVLKKGNSNKSIAIRADMDALPMQELNSFEHCSIQKGKMHACGHDGHTAILLGAAKYLSEFGRFDGTVYFVFQPAEENKGGGKAMVEAGLFERFDIDEIYGLHNWPGRALGEICINDGAMMASFDIFDIRLQGVGAHAAMPHLGKDPIVAGAALITQLQAIVSRQISPLDSAVLSITQFEGGDTYNIIPGVARLKGTIRAFDDNVRLLLKHQLTAAVASLEHTTGVKGILDYQECYPATINDSDCAKKARNIAASAFGDGKVFSDVLPTMASEDFSFMLNQKKGAYIWLGVDEVDKPSVALHNPYYDFNDNALPIGIKLWAALVEGSLAVKN